MLELICIKCESNHFKNNLCMDCMAKDHEIAKQVRAAMARPEWACCNELKDCSEDQPCQDCCAHEFVEYGQCGSCDKDVSASYNIYKNFQHND